MHFGMCSLEREKFRLSRVFVDLSTGKKNIFNLRVCGSLPSKYFHIFVYKN